MKTLLNLRTIIGITFLTILCITGLNTIDIVYRVIYKQAELLYNVSVYKTLFNLTFLSTIALIGINVAINKKQRTIPTYKINKRFFENELRDIV